jgi:hypothetical protein
LHKSHTCHTCNHLYQSYRSTSKFCSSTCRVLAHRKRLSKRTKDRYKKFNSSSFGKWLTRQTRTAGTVQILHGSTSNDLFLLKKLYDNSRRYSGYRTTDSPYVISHIYPFQSDSAIGLLHHQNLVITSRSYNSRRQSKSPQDSSALCILKTELLSKYLVTRSTSDYQVFKLIQELLGNEFSEWLKSEKLPPNSHQQLLRKLSKHIPDIDPESSYEHLQSLAKSLKLKSVRAPSRTPAPLHAVATEEATRFGLELNPYLPTEAAIYLSTRSIQPVLYSEQDEYMSEFFFDLLHKEIPI